MDDCCSARQIRACSSRKCSSMEGHVEELTKQAEDEAEDEVEDDDDDDDEDGEGALAVSEDVLGPSWCREYRVAMPHSVPTSTDAMGDSGPATGSLGEGWAVTLGTRLPWSERGMAYPPKIGPPRWTSRTDYPITQPKTHVDLTTGALVQEKAQGGG